VITAGLALLVIAPSPAGAQGLRGRGDDPISREEGRNINALLTNHRMLLRHVAHDYVDEHGSGVMTITWVADPEAHPWLVETLREHVEQMEGRLERGARIYQRDPVFRAIFDLKDQIRLEFMEVRGGIMVIETSPEPLVAELIRLHAEKVDAFILLGHDALLPPNARSGVGPRP
jgi:hypothetical protein